MPQPSYAYACARLSALNKRLLEPQTVQRMAEGSLADAMRALSDVRYGNLPDATEADAERMIERELTDAMLEVQEISPNAAITDLFLLRADVQNLKVLIKARLLNQTEPVFTPGGLFDKETLSEMVQTRQYQALPPIFTEALNKLEKQLEIRVEPRNISIALDRAYLAHALKETEKQPVFSQYFKAMADFDNVLTFLRLRAMGASIETLDDVILPEGGIGYRDLYGAYELSFDSLNRVLEKNGVTLAKPNKPLLREVIGKADLVYIEIPFALGSAAVKIARELGIGAKSVSNAVYRCKTKIKKHYEQKGK